MHIYIKNVLKDLENTLVKSVQEGSSFLNHQERDLPACYPSEREGRIEEIAQLKKQLENNQQALAEVQKMLDPGIKI